MNLRLFVLVNTFALVTGSWLSITFRRVNSAVSNVFGKEFSNTGSNIQNAMVSVERMSLTVKSTKDVIVHTSEAVEALTTISRALGDVKLSVGEDSEMVDLVNNAMTEVQFALDVVEGLGRDVKEASERYWLRPSIVLGDSVDNMLQYMNRWIVAGLAFIAAGLLVQVIPVEHKSYRYLSWAVVVVLVAWYVHCSVPERTEKWKQPELDKMKTEVYPTESQNPTIAQLTQLHIALTERLQKADCVNSRPILASLADSYFYATSRHDERYSACKSKTNSGSVWHPAPSSSDVNHYNQYVEVNLGGTYTINQIDVHGRGQHEQYLRKFLILYKADYDKPFTLLCPLGSSDCRFDGPPNSASFATHRNFLPFTASAVRLEPREFNAEAPSFRWELFGCKENDHIEESDRGHLRPDM